MTTPSPNPYALHEPIKTFPVADVQYDEREKPLTDANRHPFVDQRNARLEKRDPKIFPTRRTVLSTQLLICTAGFSALDKCKAGLGERDDAFQRRYMERLARLVYLEYMASMRLTRLNRIMQGLEQPADVDIETYLGSADFHHRAWRYIKDRMEEVRRAPRQPGGGFPPDTLDRTDMAFLNMLVHAVDLDLQAIQRGEVRLYSHSAIVNADDPRRIRAQRRLLTLWRKRDYSWWYKSRVDPDDADTEDPNPELVALHGNAARRFYGGLPMPVHQLARVLEAEARRREEEAEAAAEAELARYCSCD